MERVFDCRKFQRVRDGGSLILVEVKENHSGVAILNKVGDAGFPPLKGAHIKVIMLCML